MTRQRRNERRGGTRIVLSERDGRMFRALARFRIARTSDLVRVAFAGIRKDTAAVRLRRLFDAGFLDVRVSGQAEESIVTLGAKGRAWIAGHGQTVAGVPKGGLAHHLAIVRQWTLIVSAVNAEAAFALEVVRPDWEVREHAPGAEVVPDALVQLGVGSRGAVRLALEVDLGTESLRTFRQKIAAYDRLRTLGDGLFGWREHGLAVAIGGGLAAREQAVQRVLTDTWSGWWLTWQDEQGLRRAIHALASTDRPPLTTSHFSNGREKRVTHCRNVIAHVEEVGL